jgi:uracil phosphoribosyltransferase
MYQIVDHPLLKHKLTVLRNQKTDTKEFRELASEITMLLTYEALSNLALTPVPVETPLALAEGSAIADNIIVVPILRAGVGMLDAMLHLLPRASIGFVGLYRDPATKQPVEYYQKLPAPKGNDMVIIVDPMLATGGSINATIALLKGRGFARIKVISILAAPEGIAAVEGAHPDVEIYSGSLDERLDERKYIIPGLGDAGDRLFGTK